MPFLRELPAMLENDYGQEKGRKYLWRTVAVILTPPAIASAGVITNIHLVIAIGIIFTGAEIGGVALTWFSMGKDFQKDLDEFHESKMKPRLPGF